MTMISNVGTIIRLTGSIVDTPLNNANEAITVKKIWKNTGQLLFCKNNKEKILIIHNNVELF